MVGFTLLAASACGGSVDESSSPDASSSGAASVAAESPDDSSVAPTSAPAAPDDSTPQTTARTDLDNGTAGLLVEVDVDEATLLLCTGDGEPVEYPFADDLEESIDIEHLIEHLDGRLPVLVRADGDGRAAQVLDTPMVDELESCP